MLKLKLSWQFENEETFEGWTTPYELAQVEKELLKGGSVIKYLRDEQVPSSEFMLLLAYKMHSRITGKPTSNFDSWAKKVMDVKLEDFTFPNFTEAGQ